MPSFPPTRAAALTALLLCAVVPVFGAAKPPEKKRAERSTPWEMAEQARQQLMAMVPEERTVRDYHTVLDVYRLVYHEHPGDVHAPESIYQVGLLLADEGTTQHDPKLLTAAIGQLEFLRTQYPHSSLRGPALLEEGRIAADRLHEVKLARVKYGQFVEEYPRSAHIDEAQTALLQLRAGRLPTHPEAEPGKALSSPVASAPASSSLPGSVARPAEPATPLDPNDTAPPIQSGPSHSANGLAYVSGIRHWSTPTYTRVAIDLGDEVKYEAARVPHPDRIYFDLHGTKLAHELFGKVFAVTDDGFLRQIRAAQYANSVTRIVLDVNDVTEYSAFLLPNPYRLIIDIHGGTKVSAAGPSAPPELPAPGTGKALGAAATATPTEASRSAEVASRNSVVTREAPAVSTRTAPVPLKAEAAAMTSATVAAVPSTLASHNSAPREVSSLSQQPGKQAATALPTSEPIAVVSPVVEKPAEAVLMDKTQHDKRPRTARAESSVAAAEHTAEPARVAEAGRAAEPASDGQRSLVRALGLKIGRIVIDPGHGGHDSGTLGVGGIMEKDVVLDVGLRLGKLLHEHLGAEIIYTRSDDKFIPLETRTAIANKAEADLFISIHANSSGDETARGVETYYLNFTSQPDALDVAARENAVSDQSVHQLADLVKKITLKDKIDESREFAADVEKSLYDGLKHGNTGLKDRGVKKAPFVVLIGANMPSILTEISFVTNGHDAAQLGRGEYRERVAESIYKGIARYTSGLSGVRVAEANHGPAGPQ